MLSFIKRLQILYKQKKFIVFLVTIIISFIAIVLYQHLTVNYSYILYRNVMGKNPKRWKHSGEIVRKGKILQSINLPKEIRNDIFFIDLYMANKCRKNIGTIKVTLKQGNAIVENIIPTETIINDTYNRVISGNKNFSPGEAVLEISSDDCWFGNAVTSWLTWSSYDAYINDVKLVPGKVELGALPSNGLAIRISTPKTIKRNTITRVTKGLWQRIIFISSYLAIIIVLYVAFYYSKNFHNKYVNNLNN